MAVSDSVPSIAVVGADAGLSRRLWPILQQLVNTPVVLPGIAELAAVLDCQPISVVLLVLADSEGNSRADQSDQFEAFMQLLPRLAGLKPPTYAILLAPCTLPLERSCQAIVKGVSAIVDYRRADFADRLGEHVLSTHQHFLDQCSRQRGPVQEVSTETDGLVGNSTALNRLRGQARRAALVSDAPVIIYGESGTGKQRIAELIHQVDQKRCDCPFICVNCAAITGTLAESELFGHKKGAFTGATENRLGYFRAANGGSILLDEVSELSLNLQPKILRTLQEGLVMPVGSDQEFRVDVRVIAATNRDLIEMVNNGRFRLDLYQRLNVISLSVPPLRSRTEDIPALFEAFVRKYGHYYPGEIVAVDRQVYDVLARAIGPGNIRELENLVRQVLAFKESGNRIELGDLPRDLVHNSLSGGRAQQPAASVPEGTIEALSAGSKKLSEAVEEYERLMLARLLRRGISQTVLADRLGITRRTLYNKLHKYDLR